LVKVPRLKWLNMPNRMSTILLRLLCVPAAAAYGRRPEKPGTIGRAVAAVAAPRNVRRFILDEDMAHSCGSMALITVTTSLVQSTSALGAGTCADRQSGCDTVLCWNLPVSGGSSGR
jgi:hypothetical protein